MLTRTGSDVKGGNNKREGYIKGLCIEVRRKESLATRSSSTMPMRSGTISVIIDDPPKSFMPSGLIYSSVVPQPHRHAATIA